MSKPKTTPLQEARRMLGKLVEGLEADLDGDTDNDLLVENLHTLEGWLELEADAPEQPPPQAAPDARLPQRVQELALFRDTLKPGSRLERQLTNIIEGRRYDDVARDNADRSVAGPVDTTGRDDAGNEQRVQTIAPDARALAAAVQAFVDMTDRWHEENGDLLEAQVGDLVGVYKHPPEYLAMKAALLPTAPPAETAGLVALKEALVSNAVEFIDMGGNPLGDAAFAYRRLESSVDIYALKLAEREAAGGGK